jgi:23S rRNA (cytosine1962-C5)-methyltransferase
MDPRPYRVTLKGGPPAHPHVYGKRVHAADRGARDGDLVEVTTREGRPCGWGFVHRTSLVAVRMLSYDPEVVPDGAWLRRRIREADAIRRDVLGLPRVTNAWRIVHGEGDGLSGLVVDRYGSVGVASLYSLGWALRLDDLRAALREEVGLEDVVVRADARAAAQEGIDLAPPASRAPVEIEEHGVRFLVDPAAGHKTGFFLDQRDNRRWLAGLARGRDVFDGMTYTGGFALAAAVAGAARVRALDLDEAVLPAAVANAARNGVAIDVRHGDAFPALRALASGPVEERPEILVLDPPKWAKDRDGLAAALHRYRDLNRLALEAVRPGGVVGTHSCSGLVSEEAFLDLISGAARDLRREVRILRVAGAAPDHPVSAVFPEGRYLKSVWLTVGPPGSGPGSR